MISTNGHKPEGQGLTLAVDALADQIFAALDTDLNLRVATHHVPPGVKKVGLLVNHILDKVRQTFDELGETNRLLDFKIKADALDTAAFQQIQEASEAKSMFLATMSHELRTPLNAIIGYTEMLAEDAAEESATERSLDLGRILQSSQHLLSLINDVLDLAKVEAGKFDLEISNATFGSVIRDVAEDLRKLVEANGNTLRIEIEKPRSKICTDVRRLKQCLLNLMSNAAKFTKDGVVTIHAAAKEEELIISISDTGIGMTEDQISRVFSAFTQADAGTARKYGGTGLGLTITREIVQLLGGEVSVESKLGGGSSFTLRMPRYSRAMGQHDVGTARSKRVHDEGLHGPILVINSDPSSCAAILNFCRDVGLHAVCAFDGAAAVKAARTLRPAAVILDLSLVGTTGTEVLGLLRCDQTLAGLPIMAMMGDEALSPGATARVDELVHKPVKTWQLNRFLKSHMPSAGREAGQLQ